MAPSDRADHLVIRYGILVRFFGWYSLAAGGISLLGAAVLFSRGDLEGFRLLLGAGLLLAFGYAISRLRVVVDAQGVTHRQFRATFVPASDVRSIEIRTGLGFKMPVRHLVITVVRSDGSELRLGPSDRLKSEHSYKTRRMLVEAMRSTLNLA